MVCSQVPGASGPAATAVWEGQTFFGNWALVQTGAYIIFGSSCAKYVPVKVGGIAVCAETIQGSVGGRHAC